MPQRKLIAAPESFQTFGDLLVYLRKRARLTQEELGRAVGYSRPQITLLEKNQRRPSATTVTALFVPALDLDDAPELAQRLIELAETARQLRSNLPAPVNALIGREQAAAQVRDYLLTPHKRLVTLIGPPGIGKTRLSLQVANDLLPDFADGVFFVPLAPIADPNLVAPTILQTLNVVQTGQRSPLDCLKEGLHARQMLIVLDNFEQVIEAAALAAELLAACSRLRLIVTSRESLRVPGEWLYPVPPLALPDQLQLKTLQVKEADRFSAVHLFVERAHAVLPEFALTHENAQAIAAICRQLDGLPLAIELIAARIRQMSPQVLLAQLTGDFLLHADGMRGVPARQKTLHNTVTWSYALLPQAEQTLLRRLAVFVGGWTLPATEAVCTGDGITAREVTGLLQRLVDKSLVITDPHANERLFGLLETIRQYAHDRLVEAGESDRVQSGHASYYLHFAEEASRHLFGADQAMWLGRLDREYPNLKAALTWFETSQRTEQGLRLAVALSYFWYIRLYMTDGRSWLEGFLVAHKMRGESPTAVQAKAVLWLSELARLQGDHLAAWTHAEESRRLFEALGDQAGLAETFKAMGGIALAERRYPTARLLLEEGLTLQQTMGNSHLMAWTLNALGEAARAQDDGDAAEGFYRKALDLYRSIGDDFRTSSVLLNLGFLAWQQGHPAEARTWLQESLTICRRVNDMGNMECCLIGLAGVLSATGDSERAVKVLGAVDAAMTANGMPLDSPDQLVYENILAQLHTQLPDVTFTATWLKGQQLIIEQAIDLALQESK